MKLTDLPIEMQRHFLANARCYAIACQNLVKFSNLAIECWAEMISEQAHQDIAAYSNEQVTKTLAQIQYHRDELIFPVVIMEEENGESR